MNIHARGTSKRLEMQNDIAKYEVEPGITLPCHTNRFISGGEEENQIKGSEIDQP
uniref:Uncharacterized protein n=1 Tax=Rhizophora mucronata TaxID=61149 RepID=A0A2P2NGE4_RHIMU